METKFETFTEIIIAIKESLGIRKNSILYRIAQKNGCDISQNTFNAYIRGSRCPSFNNAKQILESLDFEIEPNKLEIILDNSRNKISRGNQLESMDFHLILNSKLFESDNIEFIKNKIEIAYSSEGFETISQYVSALIKKDLIDKGLLSQTGDHYEHKN